MPKCAAWQIYYPVHCIVLISFPLTCIPLLRILPVLEWVSVSVMVDNMASQMGWRWKRLVTRLANIRFLPRMLRPHVPSPGAGLGERIATRLTDKRFLSRMSPHVLNQVVVVIWTHATRLADVRFILIMRPLVSSHFAWSRKWFHTPRVCTIMPFGNVWLLHMSAHVISQFA